MLSLDEGSAEYAVLPIENSTAGIVSEIYDLLAEFDRKVASQKETEQKFTVAYGWAMFKPHSREDFVQAQQRADSLMYDMKKKMKSRAAMESEGKA